MPNPFMAVSVGLNQSPLVLALFVLCVVLAEIWLVWSGMSNLYLSLLFALGSAGLVILSLAFLLPLWLGFCGFLGSTMLIDSMEGVGMGFYSVCGA